MRMKGSSTFPMLFKKAGVVRSRWNERRAFKLLEKYDSRCQETEGILVVLLVRRSQAKGGRCYEVWTGRINYWALC